MKRLVAAVLLCLIPAAASAKVAVIIAQRETAEGRMQEATLAMLLSRFGVNYEFLPPTVAKTEFCRTGDVVFDFPTNVAAKVKHYDVFIHANQLYNLFTANIEGYTPDSLTRSTYAPLVPQIFIGKNSGANPFRTDANAPPESTGVAFASVQYGGTSAEDYGYTNYLVGSTYRWKSTGQMRCVVDTGTVLAGGVYSFQVVPGGFRPLVASSMTPAHDQVCQDCDSLYNQINGSGGSVSRPATEDTLLAWVRQNRHVAGAAQNIFVTAGGAQAVVDPGLLAIVLNYADSLTNGKVFENRSRLPLRAGIHIDDGWRRTGRAVSGGIYLPDTTVLKATIDSLKSLKVPFVVGVAIDSMRAFANVDSTWWERAKPYVHYTPHMHGGATTTNASLSRDGLADIHGASRARAIYNGECGSATNDTTLYCLLKKSFQYLERSFPGRVDHVLMPPTDDWTPTSITKTSGGPGLDSLFWMMDKAGARGTRANAASTTTVMGEVGYQTNPRRYPIYRTPGGSSTQVTGYFPILMTNGYTADGATTWTSGISQATSFRQGFFTGLDKTVLDWDPETPGGSQIGEKVILASHVNDYAGIDTDNAPKRPAWRQVKYIVNMFKAINAVGLPGKPIVSIVYPEQIAP